ncbi:unnamed protein product [Effrenium voratum]|nr:unnamed protein product [Effrenium voratum]
MAYEELVGAHGFEVRVRTLGGQLCNLYVDKFAMIGDVKQRLCKELGRKFHEIKLVYNATVEPDVLEKVSTFRRGGVVELTVVISRACRWCNLQLGGDRATIMESEIGDFCCKRCYTLMTKELADPNSLFVIFGISTEPPARDLGVYTMPYAEWPMAGTLHGFDSFQGLPSDWDHTHLAAGTFSTGGEIPEHLKEMRNVQIHVGLFTQTLGDLDRFGNTPVAFAHIDVDIFPSAVEVLSRIACQLAVGSILVYDELVNYVGFELSGEYRAWEYVASAYGIGWEYAGMYWQQDWAGLVDIQNGFHPNAPQAVPMVITVEHLVMKSMCAELIRGQIDEVNQVLSVTWVKPRILDPVRIDLMRERMDAWAQQTGLLLEHLEQVTPELLVS